MNSGISRLIAAFTDITPGNPYPILGAETFFGPADMASGQSLLRTLAVRNPPSFLCLIGEFGLRFKQMADDRANSADTTLLRALLDLYNKSGKDDVVGETVYSKKENNIARIAAPAMSLICESTPQTLYDNMTEGMITNGFLPRCTIVEYTGPRVARNKLAGEAEPDPEMMGRLAKLLTHCLGANSVNQVTNVDVNRPGFVGGSGG